MGLAPHPQGPIRVRFEFALGLGLGLGLGRGLAPRPQRSKRHQSHYSSKNEADESVEPRIESAGEVASQWEVDMFP